MNPPDALMDARCRSRPRVVLVEDDPDDRMLIGSAWESVNPAVPLTTVSDGQSLIDHLEESEDLPALVLMDLNMPRKGGLESLQELKAHAKLRHIPVVMLTTSNHNGEVNRAYGLGASGFITKPSCLEGLNEAMRTLHEYWFTLVRLPAE